MSFAHGQEQPSYGASPNNPSDGVQQNTFLRNEYNAQCSELRDKVVLKMMELGVIRAPIWAMFNSTENVPNSDKYDDLPILKRSTFIALEKPKGVGLNESRHGKKRANFNLRIITNDLISFEPDTDKSALWQTKDISLGFDNQTAYFIDGGRSRDAFISQDKDNISEQQSRTPNWTDENNQPVNTIQTFMPLFWVDGNSRQLHFSSNMLDLNWLARTPNFPVLPKPVKTEDDIPTFPLGQPNNIIDNLYALDQAISLFDQISDLPARHKSSGLDF